MHALIEFECRFAQRLEQDQRLVGLDKVLMFVKSIDLKERKATRIQLEDDDGANALTENWAYVERVCRQHDKRKMGILSTTSRFARDNQRRMRCGNMPPPKEDTLKKEDLKTLNIEAFIREAFENLKVQDKAEKKLKMETIPR